MKANELTGTIRIGNSLFPVTGEIIYDECVEISADDFNRLVERLRKPLSLFYSVDSTEYWIERVKAMFLEERILHYERCKRMAKRLPRKRQRYHVVYHRHKISQRRSHA